ncbi:MAG: NADH-quinone oxidoreductase subunit J [Myxococcales bacterium]|nr:NADH-quinone oxidoreductase subunit J [Myxococcales bacterium]
MKAILMFLLVALVGLAAAHAQPGHEGHAHALAGQPHPGAPAADAARDWVYAAGFAPAPIEAQPLRNAQDPNSTAPIDKKTSSGKGMALLFWAFALVVIGGGVFVITRRNMVVAVMGMVATFFAIAALYMMLYATFLSIIQIMVYAGAIMVLFVFVIMVLNRPEDEPWAPQDVLGKALAAAAILFLFVRLAGAVWGTKTPDASLVAPSVTPQGYEWGSTAAVGHELFTNYLFPFEAVSILLLIAVVGAIAVARPPAKAEEGTP